MVEHRGLVRLVAGNDFVEISPQDIFLNASSPTFDATTFEVWGALANGARVVLYPERHLSTATLAQIIQDQGVTIAWMTARLFDVYVAEGRSTNRLQQLLVGGEEVSIASIRACQKRHPTLRISNGYGPTENTTFSLCIRCLLSSMAGNGCRWVDQFAIRWPICWIGLPSPCRSGRRESFTSAGQGCAGLPQPPR
nr:AMP-binding protein [Rhizobium sp. 007]